MKSRLMDAGLVLALTIIVLLVIWAFIPDEPEPEIDKAVSIHIVDNTIVKVTTTIDYTEMLFSFEDGKQELWRFNHENR